MAKNRISVSTKGTDVFAVPGLVRAVLLAQALKRVVEPLRCLQSKARDVRVSAYQ